MTIGRKKEKEKKKKKKEFKMPEETGQDRKRMTFSYL